MLPIAVLFLYLCAVIWLLASLRTATGNLSAHGKRLIGLNTAALAWLLHGYSLCTGIFRTGNLALDLGAASAIVGWVIAAIALLAALKSVRFTVISALLLTGAGAGAALLDAGFPDPAAEPLGWTLAAHVVLAVVAYALIAVGAVLALALWSLNRRLHQRQPLGWLHSLPSVEAIEAGMFQAITAGFSLLTLTLFSGFIFVEDLFAQHLVHKTVLSCLAWLMLAILLFGRHRFGWRGRTAVRWVLGGFLLLILAYFGSKFVLEVILNKHW